MKTYTRLEIQVKTWLLEDVLTASPTGKDFAEEEDVWGEGGIV